MRNKEITTYVNRYLVVLHTVLATSVAYSRSVVISSVGIRKISEVYLLVRHVQLICEVRQEGSGGWQTQHWGGSPCYEGENTGGCEQEYEKGEV
jgi:hypothetical protein